MTVADWIEGLIALALFALAVVLDVAITAPVALLVGAWPSDSLLDTFDFVREIRARAAARRAG